MSPAWDWLYRNHLALLLVFVVACAALLVAIGEATRRRSVWHGAAWSVIPLVVIVFVDAAWSLAVRHALASDIDRRLEQVTSALPSGARRTSTKSGDNYRTDFFVVREPPMSAIAKIHYAISRRLGPTASLSDVDPQPPQLGGIGVSFEGRACDGSLDVSVLFTSSGSDTAVEVGAHCGD